jgi:hypothetical protein
VLHILSSTPSFFSQQVHGRQSRQPDGRLSKYTAAKADNKTVDSASTWPPKPTTRRSTSLGIHIASWKTFGVEVAQEVKDEIIALTRDKLRPEKLTRLNALGARQSDQFDLLEPNWEWLIEYLGKTSGEQCAIDCRARFSSPPRFG